MANFPELFGARLAVGNSDRVYVSGNFEMIGSVPRNRLARLFPSESRQVPPRIATPPLGQALKTGQTLTLQVTPTSSSCVSYQWLIKWTGTGR